MPPQPRPPAPPQPQTGPELLHEEIAALRELVDAQGRDLERLGFAVNCATVILQQRGSASPVTVNDLSERLYTQDAQLQALAQRIDHLYALIVAINDTLEEMRGESCLQP